MNKEREAFEEWFESLNKNGRMAYFLGQESMVAWEAWQTAKVQANKQFENFIDQAIEDSACADERRSLQYSLDEFQELNNDSFNQW